MNTLTIINPTDKAQFKGKTPVPFTGKADSGIVSVNLQADDQYDLGSNPVDSSGSWSITYSGFTNTGDRKITAIGFDKANQKKGETSVHIDIAKPSSVNDYTKTIYDGLVLDAYKNLEHAVKTSVDLGLSQENGCKLLEEGILPILQSVDTFKAATAKGQRELDERGNVYGIKNAPCAYSVSCAMKYIAEKLEINEVKKLFNNTFEIDCIAVIALARYTTRKILYGSL